MTFEKGNIHSTVNDKNSHHYINATTAYVSSSIKYRYFIFFIVCKEIDHFETWNWQALVFCLMDGSGI